MVRAQHPIPGARPGHTGAHWAGWLLAAALVSAGWPLAPARSGGPQQNESAAHKLYERACGHIRRAHPELAFASLQEALGYGHPHPMQVLSEGCFKPLLDDAGWRRAVHDLLRRHAWEDSTVMVTPAEPGERIRIWIRLTDAKTGEPLSRAAVELYHADSEGRYSETEGRSNPRLFACLLAGESGDVRVETVRPGSYLTGSGDPLPAHVHVSAALRGYTTLDGEILFSDRVEDTQPLREAEEGSVWMAGRVEGNTQPPTYQVALRLGRHP